MDALLARHAQEVSVQEATLRQLEPKARFGKPPSAAAVASAAATAVAKRAELEARHAAEVSAFLNAPPPPTSPPRAPTPPPLDDAVASLAAMALTPADSPATASSTPRTRAERRRERKDAAAAEEDAAAAASPSTPSGPSAREAEVAALRSQLVPLRLDIKPVPGDGHCLFRAAAHQLALLAAGVGSTATAATTVTVSPDAHLALRVRTSDFIRTFWEEFAPFLPYVPSDGHPEEDARGGGGGGGDGSAIRAAVGRYCDRMATTASWGGHPELRALANVLGCPVVVYRAGAAPLQFEPAGAETQLGGGGGSAGGRNALRLTFHASYHALGEHYNSCVPCSSH